MEFVGRNAISPLFLYLDIMFDNSELSVFDKMFWNCQQVINPCPFVDHF